MRPLFIAAATLTLLVPSSASAQGLALSLEIGGDFGGDVFARQTIPVVDCVRNTSTGVETCSSTSRQMLVDLSAGGGASVRAGLDVFVFERGGHVLEVELDLGFSGQSDGSDDASVYFRRVSERALLLYRNARAQLRLGGGLFNVSSARVSADDSVFMNLVTDLDATPGFTALVGWAHPWLGFDVRFTRVVYRNQSAPAITTAPIDGWSLGFAFRFTIPLFGKTPCHRAYPVLTDFSGCRRTPPPSETAPVDADWLRSR